MSLIVTGTIGIDTVHTPDGRAEGVLGGSCAYFAAAASFFAPVRIVAAVGGDWPDDHRATLNSFANISMDGLEYRGNSRTFAWGGRYFDNMNQRETLFTELGVLEEAPPAVPETFLDSEYVFLANTHPAEQLKLLEKFPNCRLSVADSMNLWINIAHDELMELLKRIDGFIINDEEALQLTEIPNAVSAARAILKMGPEFVIVKKGEHGCILVSNDDVATLPAFPSESHQIVDPTGAGDAFAGGVMGHIASVGMVDFETIHSALGWGTVAASFAIESFSLTSLHKLTRMQIEDRLSAFRSAARVG